MAEGAGHRARRQVDEDGLEQAAEVKCVGAAAGIDRAGHQGRTAPVEPVVEIRGPHQVLEAGVGQILGNGILRGDGIPVAELGTRHAKPRIVTGKDHVVQVG